MNKEIKEIIFETTDYDKFHRIPGNRKTQPMKVKRLAARIRKVGFLPNRAIEVNPDMGIIDGQHRLLAAMEAGVPVLYKISEKPATLTDIQGLQMATAWSSRDFIQSYIELGRKEYIELQAFADEYRLSLALATRILGGLITFRGVLKMFEEDTFRITNRERAEQLASLVGEVRNYTPDQAFADLRCVRALEVLMDKIDPKILFNQLKKYQQVITRRYSVKDYLLQFENILNQGNQGKQIELT